jgi:hypothetical protein
MSEKTPKSETGIDKKLEAALGSAQPKLFGKVVSEADDGVVLQAGGCIVEVPKRHIAERFEKGNEVVLTLNGDAEILVSTAVSVQKGFVADDVFGALVPSVLACNCNCNCNCSEKTRLLFDACNCNCNCDRSFDVAVETSAAAPARVFRRSFTGGAKG